ncbi:hypothetical protein KA005_42365 [bacterium]|nr:hypothetical protein [bacterium]
MKFNYHNPYAQHSEEMENERLEEDLLEQMIRQEAEKVETINLDEHGNEIDPTVKEWLEGRDESWTDNGNLKE